MFAGGAVARSDVFRTASSGSRCLRDGQWRGHAGLGACGRLGMTKVNSHTPVHFLDLLPFKYTNVVCSAGSWIHLAFETSSSVETSLKVFFERPQDVFRIFCLKVYIVYISQQKLSKLRVERFLLLKIQSVGLVLSIKSSIFHDNKSSRQGNRNKLCQKLIV